MWTNLIIQLLNPIILIAIFIVILLGIKKVFHTIKHVRYVEKFTEYRSVLEYHMEKAYGMIHKEHILTYSLDAFRIEDEQYDKISQEFVRLVQKFVGPMMLKEFIYLYGDDDTFVFTLLEFFSDKYEGDEIRNAAMEQITEIEPGENKM